MVPWCWCIPCGAFPSVHCIVPNGALPHPRSKPVDATSALPAHDRRKDGAPHARPIGVTRKKGNANALWPWHLWTVGKTQVEQRTKRGQQSFGGRSPVHGKVMWKHAAGPLDASPALCKVEGVAEVVCIPKWTGCQRQGLHQINRFPKLFNSGMARRKM